MDDVIRIRIDTTQAVKAFLTLLVEQAAEGEARAPANPAATAIWRELAPFRLVEYGYVDESVGPIVGAYLGFPDGTLYAAGDDIPETAVTDLVKGSEHRVVDLPPIYVYVVLDHPVDRAAVGGFLIQLAAHVGHSLDDEACEADRRLSKDMVLGRFAVLSQRSDGRSYAALTYAYAKQMLEFSSAAERDDFIGWTRALCDWIFSHGDNSGELGFAEMHRPAELVPIPEDGRQVIRLAAPCSFENGGAWDCMAPDAVPETMGAARDYWGYVRRTIDESRAGTAF